MLFPFCSLKFKVFWFSKMSKQKNKRDFKAKNMAELQERGVLVVEIPILAAEMVLTLELNLERDKTGDVGKFHDTYIIHISKFMITRY